MKNLNTSLNLIGNTPLINLTSTIDTADATILGKAEFINNGGSVKDRIAMSMITEAEITGQIIPGATIIEATSGNTGIGLAWIASLKGYKIILTMPESMSIERRKLLKAYGAHIVLTSAKEGMAGAVNKAIQLSREIPDSFIPDQFSNIANPLVHYQTTGPEIWEATSGNVDIFISGVGTGGTITGVGRYLKKRNPSIKIIAVEPEASAVLSGEKSGPHGIQGIGAGFIPKVLQLDIIDDIIKISDKDAYQGAKDISRKNGLLVGISSGANIAAIKKYVLQNKPQNLTIVTMLHDTGERYLSTKLFD